MLSDRNFARAATSDESPNSSKEARFRDRLCWAVLLLSWKKILVEENFIAALIAFVGIFFCAGRRRKIAELSANSGETSRSNLRPLKIQTPAGWLNPGFN